MKKKIITLSIALICILSLASCGQDIAKEAAEKGRNYFESGDYETAAKAFGVAIDNGSTEEEIKLLYDITLKYHQANQAFTGKKYETAQEIIASIDSKYMNYPIKEKILTLQENIEKTLEAERLLNEVAEKIELLDYSMATISAEKIDISSLSDEQAEKLNEYKSEIATAQAEIARQAELQRIAEEEAKKAAEEAAKKAAEEEAAKKTAETAKKQSQAKTAAKTNKNTGKTAAQSKPVINTNVASNAYIYPTDTTLLTTDQLKTLSRADLALIRNEIYARKGHIFTTDKYISYFSGKTWYTPSKTIYWADLNSIERANIRLIKDYESTL